jgi:integrase
MKAEITKDELTKLGKQARTEGRTLLLYDTELPRFGARATKTGFVSYILEYNLGGRGAPKRRVTLCRHTKGNDPKKVRSYAPHLETNPMDGIAAPEASDSRKRVLSKIELATLLRAHGELGYPFGHMYSILILTGLRLKEAAKASWQEFDMKERTWTIPAERMKGKIAHRVYLSDQVIAILESAKEQCFGSPFVFSADGKKPVAGFASAKMRLDKLMAKEAQGEIEPWRSHDIRRTFATRMAEDLGIDEGVIERCAARVVGGVKGVYHRQEYVEKRKDAYQRWADYCDALKAG